MTLNPRQFFHGTRHDIRHVVRPAKDTGLANYGYGEDLPATHAEHTFAGKSEQTAWAWSDVRSVTGRRRVYTVEPEGPTKPDPIVTDAVMHRGGMWVRDTTWIPPLSVARRADDTANWEHVADAKGEHVQGTLPPLNWDEHHRYYERRRPAQGERNTHLVDSIGGRFEPTDPEWHEAKRINAEIDRTTPGFNQDPLFPTGQYYDPKVLRRS